MNIHGYEITKKWSKDDFIGLCHLVVLSIVWNKYTLGLDLEILLIKRNPKY